MKKKIAIIFGGQSTEHEVSRVSASSVLKNIDEEKYCITRIGITKDGRWLKYNGTIENIENGKWEEDLKNLEQNAQDILFKKEVDVVFPVLHGLYGEDGTVQGLCKLTNIPYVGCGVLSSALCMDKVYTKYVCETFKIRQADYLAITNSEYKEKNNEIIEEVESRIGYPVFIKPSNSGSSVGITKAHDRKELCEGIVDAFKYDRKVVIEKGINGREIEVAVLGNVNVVASIPGEILPAKEFYDYEAKYQNEDSKLMIPAKLSEDKTEEIRKLSIKIFKALDCKGCGRVDFLVDKETSEIYFNEVNTLPGFTSISMYPKLWEYMGKSFTKLIDELIELAIERSTCND